MTGINFGDTRNFNSYIAVSVDKLAKGAQAEHTMAKSGLNRGEMACLNHDMNEIARLRTKYANGDGQIDSREEKILNQRISKWEKDYQYLTGKGVDLSENTLRKTMGIVTDSRKEENLDTAGKLHDKAGTPGGLDNLKKGLLSQKEGYSPTNTAPRPTADQNRTSPPPPSNPKVKQEQPRNTEVGKTQDNRNFDWTLFAIQGGQILQSKAKNHRNSIDKTGVGTHYGDHSQYKSLPRKASENIRKGHSPRSKEEWLKANARPGSTPSTPKESSCIGWSMENLRSAYKVAGKEERWEEIEKNLSQGVKTTVNGKTVTMKMRGIDLAKELEKDGWQAIYFNPDTKNGPVNTKSGKSEGNYTASLVKNGKSYYGIKPNGVVTDYNPTDGRPADTSGMEKLKNVPFWFGIASGGQHTFVGYNDKVSEFHWKAEPNDPRAIDEMSLQKFPWADGGLIMVPPGTWQQ